MGLAATALTAWRPVFGAALLVISIPLTAGLGRDTVIPVFRVTEALTIVVGLGLAIHLLPLRRERPYTTLDVAVGVFGACALMVPMLVLVLTDAPLDLATARNVLAPVQYLALYFIFSRVSYGQSDLRLLLQLAMGTSVLVALVGIAQLADVPGVRDLINAYYLRERPSSAICQFGVCRPTSLLEHWSSFGAYAVMHYSIALVLLTRRSPHFPAAWLTAVATLNSVAALISQTQAAVAGMIVATIVITLHARRRVPRELGYGLAGIAIALVLFWPAVSARLEQQLGAAAGEDVAAPESLQTRQRYWAEIFIPALEPHVWFGTGTVIPTTVPDRLERYVDSEYLRMGFRAGIVGVAALIMLFAAVAIAAAAYSATARDDLWEAVSGTAFAFVVVLAVMGIAAEYTTYAGVAQPLWTVIGLAGAARLAAAERA